MTPFAWSLRRTTNPIQTAPSSTCNKNGIPFDPEKPMITSGVHLGTPTGTTRGFGVAEFETISDLVMRVLGSLAKDGAEKNGFSEAEVRK